MKFILFILLIISFLKANNDVILIKEYTYEANDYDSKITSREKAIQQIKLIANDELGVFVQNDFSIEKELVDTDYHKKISHNIQNLSATFMKIKVLEENWNGSKFYLKAQIIVDKKASEELKKSIIEQKRFTTENIEKQIKEQLLKEKLKNTQIIKNVIILPSNINGENKSGPILSAPCYSFISPNINSFINSYSKEKKLQYMLDNKNEPIYLIKFDYCSSEQSNKNQFDFNDLWSKASFFTSPSINEDFLQKYFAENFDIAISFEAHKPMGYVFDYLTMNIYDFNNKKLYKYSTQSLLNTKVSSFISDSFNKYLQNKK